MAGITNMTKLQVNASQMNFFGYNPSMSKVSHKYPMERSEVVRLLQGHNVTPTRQRIEIASYLFQRRQHISADRILEGVNALGSRVSRATVYNTMALFAGKGLVREVLLDRERVFYDTNVADHHHVYDVESGELHDIMHTDVEITRLPEIPEGKEFIGADVIFRVGSKTA